MSSSDPSREVDNEVPTTTNPIYRESLQIDISNVNAARVSEQQRQSQQSRLFSFHSNRPSQQISIRHQRDIEGAGVGGDRLSQQTNTDPEDPELVATISEISDISESFVSTMGSLSISSRMSIMGMVQRRQDKTFYEAIDRQAGLRFLLSILGLLSYDRHRGLCFNFFLRLYYYGLRGYFLCIYLPYTIYLWAKYNSHHSAYDANNFLNFTYVVNNYLFTNNLLQIFLGCMLWWQLYDRIMVRACSTLDALIASKMTIPTYYYLFFILIVTLVIYPVGAHFSQYISALNAQNATDNHINHKLESWYLYLEVVGQLILGQILSGMFLFFFADTNITLMLLEETTELIVHEKLSVPTTMMMKQEIHARNHFNHMSNPYTNDQTLAGHPNSRQNSQNSLINPKGRASVQFRHSAQHQQQAQQQQQYVYDDFEAYREHHLCLQVLLGNGYTTVSALCLFSTIGFVLRLYVHEGALGALYLACLLFLKEVPLFVVIVWRAMKINERSNWMMRLLGENIWEESLELTRSLVFMNMASYPISFKILGYRVGYRALFYALIALVVTIVGGFIRIIVQVKH
jgi:hypothetical protein